MPLCSPDGCADGVPLGSLLGDALGAVLGTSGHGGLPSFSFTHPPDGESHPCTDM